MSRIHIANIDNENMVADRTVIDFAFRSVSAMCARRMVWFAEPGDIVVVPNDLSRDMKQYIARLMGREPNEAEVLFPNLPAEDMRPLGSEELSDPTLVSQIKHAMGSRTDWELRPYYHDRTIAHLARRLGLPESSIVRFQPFLREGGAEILNDKATFRNLAAGRGVSLARGEVCKSLAELHEAVVHLMADTGAVILKQNRHSGAEGNVIVALRTDTATQGALRQIIIDDPAAIGSKLTELWAKLDRGADTVIVAETYYAVRSILYAEFDVDARLNSVNFLNWGEQRMEPIFMGFVVPPNLPAYAAANFIAGATELARLTCDVGFSGLMDVDGIVTDDGRVVFNEVNARSGGCSHIHHIARKLLGEDYGDRHVIMSHNRVQVTNMDLARSTLSGSSNALGFDERTKTGVIVTSEDLAISGMLEFMSIAASRDEAKRLEREFEDAITGNSDQQHERMIA